MKRLFSREFILDRQTIKLLGSCVVDERLCYVLETGRRHIVLLASITPPPSGRSFARGQTLYLEYRTDIAEPLGTRDTMALEVFVKRLLRAEAATARQLAEDAPTPQFTILEATSDDTGDRTVLQLPGIDAPVAVIMAPAQDGPLRLFRHAPSVVGDLEPPAARALQQFLVYKAAHTALGTPYPALPGGGSTAREGSGREFFTYFAPARPDFNASSIPKVGSADRLRVSFEVPSSCQQQCVFCVAWQACDAGQQPMDGPELLAAATRVLEELGEVASTSGQADVILVGQDAVAHPACAELVRLFKAHDAVGRLAIVTPGTHLATRATVEALALAGLDAAIVTLLGDTAELHDRLAGRPGALDGLEAAVEHLNQHGIDLEFNTVLLAENIERFPHLLERARSWGKPVRVYAYTSEPMVPLEQARRCAADPATIRQVLATNRSLVEAQVSSLHYAPLCLLPPWVRPLASHASQSLPAPADPLPTACQSCPLFEKHCPSVSQHHTELFGVDDLTPLDPAG